MWIFHPDCGSVLSLKWGNPSPNSSAAQAPGVVPHKCGRMAGLEGAFGGSTRCEPAERPATP